LPLTAAAPVAHCRAVDEFVPSATLEVVKTISGDPADRTAAHVNVQCNDAQDANLSAPAGQPGPFRLSTPLRFWDFLDAGGPPTLQCRVRETQDGAATGGSVATSMAVVVDGSVTQTVDGDNVLVSPRPGQHVVVHVANDYTAATSPSTGTPTPAPTNSGNGAGGTGGTGSLPGTGVGDSAILALLGVALVALGAVLVALARTRRIPETQ